ncbi:MAG: hypothetical protein PVJ34_16820, partial [Anaerolineae bacterium]
MKKRVTFPAIPSLRPVAATVGHKAAGLPAALHLFAAGSDNDDKETVRTRRRRRTDSGTGGRQRAEAPSRRRSSGQAQRPSGSKGTGGGQRPPSRPPSRPSRPSYRPSGGQLPVGRMSPLMIGGFLVVACIFVAIWALFLRGEDLGIVVDEPSAATAHAARPTEPAPATNTPRPFVPPVTSGEGQTWLVMLYQDADDKVLEQDIYLDLNEAERVGSTDRVQIVTQVDRYRAGYQGDGNWTGAKRFYITQDSDLGRVGSELVADLGEVNMSDGATLVDFVTWAIDTFPA